MSRVKSKNTKPEMIVRKFLHGRGFRYRLHIKDLPGRPDIVLPKYRTVIFVNGCFWHGHQACKKSGLPKTNTEWWRKKIETNVHNDSIAINNLKNMGWEVITIWECQLLSKDREEHLKSVCALLSAKIVK